MQTKIDYKKYLKSDYWKDIKEQVHKRDNYKCRLCNSENNLQVHHKTYEFLGNENLEELITLCKKCHFNIHKIGDSINYTTYQRYSEYNRVLQQKEQEDIIFSKFVYVNIDKFIPILKNIDNNNYIKSKDFNENIKNIIKYESFDIHNFIYFCMDYFNLVYSFCLCSKFKIKYNLPSTSYDKPIIIRKDFYKENKDDLSIVCRIYDWAITDIRDIFKQTI